MRTGSEGCPPKSCDTQTIAMMTGNQELGVIAHRKS